MLCLYFTILLALKSLGKKGVLMNNDLVQRVKSNPKFHELVSKRDKLGLRLSIAMLAVYYGFVLVLAFAPEILAIKIGTVTTLGIPVGMGIILFAFILTGIYTKKANGEFDDLTKAIKEEAKSV